MTAYENPWLRNTVGLSSADIDEQMKRKEEVGFAILHIFTVIFLRRCNRFSVLNQNYHL